MSRKLVLVTTLMIVLIGMFGVAFVVQPVKAVGPYYIKADGSISPSTPLISTVDNVTYTLTGNIVIDTNNDGIIVEKDNIVIDGAGYILQGPGLGYYDTEGIRAQGIHNITIRNITITAFWNGIWLRFCSNCTICWNNITNSYYGIDFQNYSNYTNVYENDIANNDAGIMLSYSWNSSIYGNNIEGNDLVGIAIGSFSHNIDVYDNNITDNYDGVGLGSRARVRIHGNNITNNNNYGVRGSCSNYSVYENNITGNTKYGITLSSSSNNSIFDNEINANGYCGIYLHSSSNNNEIYGNRIANNTQHGVRLAGSVDYNKIFGNNVTGNEWSGFFVSDCLGNDIYANNIGSNDDGINIAGSLNTSIHENRITGNGYGIYLLDSSNYTNIFENEITANHNGIYLSQSSNYNNVFANNVTNSLSHGIRLSESSNNTFYHNHFINNTVQAYVTPGYVNTWDNGYPSGGNYWSDYTDVDQYSGPYQNETGSDGFWDNPYVIDADNQDNYPFGITLAEDTTSPSISDVSHDPEVPDDGQTVTVTVNVTDEESGVHNVTLSYSTDGGGTWNNITMTKTTGNTYQEEIPGFEAGTNVQYKIIAYDNAGNPAVEDNTGSYYVYTVVPEFSTLTSMLIMLIILTAAIVIYKRKLPKTSASSLGKFETNGEKPPVPQLEKK